MMIMAYPCVHVCNIGQATEGSQEHPPDRRQCLQQVDDRGGGPVDDDATYCGDNK